MQPNRTVARFLRTCVIVLSLTSAGVEAALQLEGVWTEGGPATTSGANPTAILGGGISVAMAPDGRHLFTTASYQAARNSNCHVDHCTTTCRRYQEVQEAGGDDDAVSVFEVQADGTLKFVSAVKDFFQGEGNVLHSTVSLKALYPVPLEPFLLANVTKRDPRGLVPCLDGVNDVAVSPDGRAVVVTSSKSSEGTAENVAEDIVELTVGPQTLPMLNVLRHRGRCVTVFSFDPDSGGLEYQPFIFPDFSVNPDYDTDKPPTQPYGAGLLHSLSIVAPDPPLDFDPGLQLVGAVFVAEAEIGSLSITIPLNTSSPAPSLPVDSARLFTPDDGKIPSNHKQGAFLMSPDLLYVYVGLSLDSVRAVEVYLRLQTPHDPTSTANFLESVNPPLRDTYVVHLGQDNVPISTTTCLALSPDSKLLYAGFVVTGPYIPDVNGGITVFSRDSTTGLLTELYEVQGRRQAMGGSQPMVLDNLNNTSIPPQSFMDAQTSCDEQLAAFPDASIRDGRLCAQWHISLVPRTIMPHPDGRRVFVLGGTPELVDGHLTFWWDPDELHDGADDSVRPDSSRLVEFRWDANATHNFAELWFTHGTPTECCAPWMHPMSHAIPNNNPPIFDFQTTWHTHNVVPSLKHAASAVMDPTGQFIYVISKNGGDPLTGKGALTWFTTNTTLLEVDTVNSRTVNVTLRNIMPTMQGDIRDREVRVRVGPQPCPSCTWSDRGPAHGPATLLCTVPEGLGRNLPVSLQYFHAGDGLDRFITVAETLAAYHYLPGLVTSVHPNAASPGDFITLVGHDFGSQTSARTPGELFSQGSTERTQSRNLNVLPVKPRLEGDHIVIPLNTTTLVKPFPASVPQDVRIPLHIPGESTIEYRNLEVDGGCPSALYPTHCDYEYKPRRINLTVSKRTEYGQFASDWGFAPGDKRDTDWHSIRVRTCNDTEVVWRDNVQVHYTENTNERKTYLDSIESPHISFAMENFPMEIRRVSHTACDDSQHATVALTDSVACQAVRYINSTALGCTIPRDAAPGIVGSIGMSIPSNRTDFSVLGNSGAVGLLHIMCDKGMYHDSASNQCQDCPPGKYNNITEAQCKSCPQGFYCGNTRQITPLICGPGTYSGIGMLACSACDIGTYAPLPSTSECTKCPVGHYCPTTSMVAPVACLAGTYQSGVRGSECIPCPPGTFSATNVAHNCTDCPVNKYNDEFGGTRCTDCPYQSKSPAQSSSINQCHCPDIVQFGNHALNISCSDCPQGAVCSLSSVGSNPYPTPNTGKWNTRKAPGEIHSCSPSSACEGEMDSCASGYGGEACSECLDGYYRLADGSCAACARKQVLPLGVQYLLLISLCVAITTAVLVAFCLASAIEYYLAKRGAAKDIASMRAVMPSSRGNGCSKFIAGSLKKLRKVPFLAGRVLRLGQLSSMVFGMQVDWPNSLTLVKAVMNAADMTNVNTGVIGPAAPDSLGGCTYDEYGNPSVLQSYFSSFMLRMLMPAIVSLASALLILLSVVGSKVWSWNRLGQLCKSITNNTLKGMLVISQTFYLPLASLILDVFTCVERVSGKFYLLSEPSIQCFVGTGHWPRLAGFASVSMVVYVLGIPLAFGSVLFWIRNRLDNPRVIRRYGVLYTQYEGKYFWYELVILAQKFGFAISLPMVSRGVTQQLNFILLVSMLSIVTLLPAMPYEEGQNDVIDATTNLFVLVLATSGVMFNAGNLTVEANLFVQLCVIGMFVVVTVLFAVVGMKEMGVLSLVKIAGRPVAKLLNRDAGEGQSALDDCDMPSASLLGDSLENLRAHVVSLLQDGLDAGLWADSRLPPDSVCKDLYRLVQATPRTAYPVNELFKPQHRRLLMSLVFALRVAEGSEAAVNGREPEHLQLLPCGGSCVSEKGRYPQALESVGTPRSRAAGQVPGKRVYDLAAPARCSKCRGVEGACVALRRFVESLELRSSALGFGCDAMLPS